MSGLSYKVEKKVFEFDSGKTERYVATAVRASTVGFEKMIDQVSLRSGVSKAACRAVMETMVEAAGTWLLEGHGVSVGELGYLKPSFTCKSSDTLGEEKILRKRVLFQPSKSFKRMIDRLPLERIGMAETGENTEKPTPGPGGGGGDNPDFS